MRPRLMNPLTTLALALLTACSGGSSNNTSNVSGALSGGANDDGVDVPSDEADEVLTGDLADGEKISLDWADDSSIACWPATENENFNGNHVFFTVDKGGKDDIIVEADPASGVDVSLYTLEFSVGSEQTPPDITSAARCEAAFDAQNDANSGEPEATELYGFGDRTLLIGVAGAKGATSGAFTVRIWKSSANGLDDSGT